MAFTNPVTLPQDILDRIARVMDYHDSTRHTPESLAAEPVQPDPTTRPYEFLVFEMLPKVDLPPGLIDLSGSTLSLMRDGLAAVPAAQVGPPQDLKTLATWLHFADGIASKRRTVTQTVFTRTCFSDGGAFPCELYVFALAVDGLEAGLYHYAPREFALRKLRNGPETLSRLTRGRPDLMFLKTVPAAIFVSTLFSRSTWRFGRRGYRNALHDAGYLVQNLVTVATGLGIQTMTRLHLNESATRELIGVPPDADFAQAESVQAMIVWADRATCPMDYAPRAGATATAAATAAPAGATATGATATAGTATAGTATGATATAATRAPVAAAANSPARPVVPLSLSSLSDFPPARGEEALAGAAGFSGSSAGAGPGAGGTNALPPIERSDIAPDVVPYVSILEAHSACVAPGVALRELRSPLTDTSPLAAGHPTVEMPVSIEGPPAGDPLRKVLLTRQATPHFGPRPLSRHLFATVNELTFRGGTFFPLHPDGPHVALVRPMWIVHNVQGMDPGVWYYNPITDHWATVRHGGPFRKEAARLALDQPAFGQCAATCVLIANLQPIMSVTGPDLYRLAHIESGIVTNRMALSCEGVGLAWFESGQFYDEQCRQFLGLQQSGWQPLNVIAVGMPAGPQAPAPK